MVTPLSRPVPQAFLAASIAAADAHIAAVRRARRNRLFTAAVVFLFLLSLATSGTAAYSWRQADNQRQQADDHRRTATARSLFAEADIARDRDPRKALRLVLAASLVDLDLAAAALNNLATVLGGHPIEATLAGHAGSVYAVALTPDGRTALTGSDNSTAILWDLTTTPTHPQATLTGHTNRCTRSPDPRRPHRPHRQRRCNRDPMGPHQHPTHPQSHPHRPHRTGCLRSL
jgi:hypothetical protein